MQMSARERRRGVVAGARRVWGVCVCRGVRGMGLRVAAFGFCSDLEHDSKGVYVGETLDMALLFNLQGLQHPAVTCSEGWGADGGWPLGGGGRDETDAPQTLNINGVVLPGLRGARLDV